MKMKWLIWSSCILCLAFGKGYGQTILIDGLRQQYYGETNAEKKLEAIISLCEYHQSIHKDSLYKYAFIAQGLAAKKQSNIDKSRASIILINAYLRQGKIDSATTITDAELQRYQVKDPASRTVYFKLSALKVDCFGETSNFKDAISELYKIISEAEQYKDSMVLAKNMSTLGVINYNLDHVPESFSWYFKGLAYCEDAPRFYPHQAVLFINIAEAYRWIEKIDSSTYFIDRALRVKANIYKQQKKYELAEKIIMRCIGIRQKAEGVLPLSNEQLSLAGIYMHKGSLDKAIVVLNDALALSSAVSVNAGRDQSAANEADALKIAYYTLLAKCYELKGDDKNCQSTLRKIIVAKDALYEANSARAIAELQTKYEFQKKESTIIKQKLAITQKNYLFYGSLILSIMILLLFWLLFKNYSRKQSVKMQLAVAEEKRIATQSIIDAEEQERKRIAADLHDNIGAYASAIRADVEKIAGNSLVVAAGPLQNLQQHSQEIIDSLRDTIWVLNKENITITGISDRIKNYLSKLRPSYEHIQIQLTESIVQDTRLSSQHALNVFRIIQEAIHNALKHSEANLINIHISSDEVIVIKVMDNGKGMEAGSSTNGNGLLNMQARAKETGMQLSIQSDSLQGTVLVLETGTTNLVLKTSK
jgi:signal transduction histidine kinase